MKRRDFINMGLISGGGLLLGLNKSLLDEVCFPEKRRTYSFNPFLKITNKGEIIIFAPVPELGQGTRTSLPMILAEELCADWSDIKVQQAVSGELYGNMSAAGSTSVERFYDPLRKAGAIAREMLISAASYKWNTEPGNLTCKNSFVINRISGESASFFDLADLAASLPVPEKVILKKPSEFTLIGTNKKSYDLLQIVQGQSKYGLDVVLPGMKYAAIERCPVRGGKLIGYDSSKALAVEGVIEVFEMKPFSPTPYAEVLSGVVVIAEDTASALKGKKNLVVQWEMGEIENESEEIYLTIYEKAKLLPPEMELRKKGISLGQDSNEEILTFDYYIPFWAHYCMEPMNFTAHYTPDHCLLIGSNQRPQLIQDLVSEMFNIPKDKVEVISTLSGGGFGRRLAVDYALEAILISKEINNPVKVIWTREDDVDHDYFRTLSFHDIKVGIKNNQLNSWFHHLLTKPIGDGAVYEVQGAADLPFEIPNVEIGYSQFPTKIRIGSWRSVAHTFGSFVVNNTITEIAAHLGKDPLDFYLELMADKNEVIVKLPFRGYRGNVVCNVSRLRKVLIKAAELSGWREHRSTQTALGIACIYFKDSYAAHVVEVEKSGKNILIRKVTAVLDCGQVINPLGVKAQMEGAISDAITVTLKSKITIRNGRPQERNFNQYPVTRISDMPQMQLHIMKSEFPPSGVGEPPFPSVPPAIANAVFRLTGKKTRTLPIKL